MYKKLILFLFVFFIFSCSNDKSKNQDTTLNKNETQSKIEMKKIPEIEMTIPIQKIKQLTVENWVKIYLSLMEHQNKWTAELQKFANNSENTEISLEEQQENPELENRKNQQEVKFFESWGVKRNDFEDFALKYDKEIQNYIEKNVEIQEIIEKLQEMNMQLYTENE